VLRYNKQHNMRVTSKTLLLFLFLFYFFSLVYSFVRCLFVCLFSFSQQSFYHWILSLDQQLILGVKGVREAKKPCDHKQHWQTAKQPINDNQKNKREPFEWGPLIASEMVPNNHGISLSESPKVFLFRTT